MRTPIYIISPLLAVLPLALTAQNTPPAQPVPAPLPSLPVDPSLVPGSPSVAVETDITQHPSSNGLPKQRRTETPATVVVRPTNPFAGFRLIDRDQDGTLTIEELTSAFKRADFDGDSRLSLEEFQRDIVAQPLDAGGTPDPPQIIINTIEGGDETHDSTGKSNASSPSRNSSSKGGTNSNASRPDRGTNDEDGDDVNVVVPDQGNGTGDPNLPNQRNERPDQAADTPENTPENTNPPTENPNGPQPASEGGAKPSTPGSGQPTSSPSTNKPVRKPSKETPKAK